MFKIDSLQKALHPDRMVAMMLGLSSLQMLIPTQNTRAETALPSDLSFARAVKAVAPSTVTVACVVAFAGNTKREWEALTEQHKRIMLAKGAVIQVGDEAHLFLGHGSGFCIDAKGHMVTNNHVVDTSSQDHEGEVQYAVCVGNTNVWHPATLIGRDPATDIAVIHSPSASATPATWGNSDALQQGDIALAIGTPQDLELRQTVTLGVISATGRNLGGLLYEDFIQTDASINSGNSGGPLINLRGEIIGVNQSIRLGGVTSGGGDTARSGNGSPLRADGNIGLGFSVPSNLARHVAQEIIDFGRVRRAFLGLKLSATVAHVGGIDADALLIEDVLPKTPAEAAGLKSGDIILALAGRPISTIERFHLVVSLMTPGSRTVISLLREGKPFDQEVTLGDLSSTRYAAIGFDPVTQEPPQFEGVELRLLDGPDDETVVAVVRVDPDCPAAKAGLRAPSIITAVAGVPVTSLQEFEKAAALSAQGGHLLLTIRTLGKRSIGSPVDVSIPVSTTPQD